MAAPRRIFNPFPHLSTDNFTEKSFAGTQKHNILGTNLDVFSPQTTIWYWHQKIKVSKNIDCKFGHQVVHLICNTIGKNSFDELILSTILVISVLSYLHTRAVVEERRGVHQPVDYKFLPLPTALRKSKILLSPSQAKKIGIRGWRYFCSSQWEIACEVQIQSLKTHEREEKVPFSNQIVEEIKSVLNMIYQNAPFFLMLLN